MKGFTLLETLVAIAFTAVILTVLAAFFVSANETYEFQRATIEQERQARLVADRIEDTVRMARAVVETHQFEDDLRATSDQVLVLAVPAVDTEGAVVEGYLDYIAFYQEGSLVYEEIAGDSESARESGTRVLASAIHDLSFIYDTLPASEVGAVTLQVATRTVTHGQQVNKEERRTLYLRNAP